MATTTGNVNSLATRIATEAKAIRTLLNGNLSSLSALSTTAQTNLVAAINEVYDMAESAAGGGITESEVQDLIDASVATLIGGAPGALDTLNELAAAIADDASYAATITTALGLKAPLASPALTGTPTAPTATGGTNTTQVATTAFVTAAITSAAVAAASDTVAGKVELATNAETATGTDATRAVTPAGLRSVLGNQDTDFVSTFEAGLV